MDDGEPLKDDHEPFDLPPEVVAGLATATLLNSPRSWIRRRVETIEMLAHEEIHRRVSIDFVLDGERQKELTIADGVAVPIAVLTKEPRRNFSLRDEGGRAVPVLGKEQNGDIAHLALLNLAYETLPQDPSMDALEMLSADLRQVVTLPRVQAGDALGHLMRAAEAGDPWRAPVIKDPTCWSLLNTLADNYVLFAVLAPDGPARRILKYSYSEEFFQERKFEIESLARRERLRRWTQGMWRPQQAFVIECPGADRAASFHLEMTTAEELRFTEAYLLDDLTEESLSARDVDVNRVSLYAVEPIEEGFGLDVYVEIAPERAGVASQAAVTSCIVAALLWAGYCSELDTGAPGSAVSLLLGGAALFSGVTATRGEHRLVTQLFRWTRLWLIIVTLAGLTASASLALAIPDKHPTQVWLWAAIICTVAAVNRASAAIRSPP